MRGVISDCVFMCWKKYEFQIVLHAHQMGCKGALRRDCVSTYCTNADILCLHVYCVECDAHVYSKHVRARRRRQLHRYHLPHMTALHRRHQTQAVCSAEQLHVTTAALTPSHNIHLRWANNATRVRNKPHEGAQQPAFSPSLHRTWRRAALTAASPVQVSWSVAPSAPSESFDRLGWPPFQS